jgi:H+/Cl- antiporter ClcA
MLFALHMAGDQQLLAGLLLAGALGAYAGRMLLKLPVYHALAALDHHDPNAPAKGST